MNTRVRFVVFTAFTVASASWCLPASAQLNTLQITTATIAAAPSCMSWRPSGVCFWLKCSWFKCSVRTSLRVTHFAPDVVVSTYHDTATHPWSDFGRATANLLQGAGSMLSGMPVDSAGTKTGESRRNRTRMFRDADAIGNPVAAISQQGLGGGGVSFVCPAAATAFRPYYSSFTDSLVWRAILPIEILYPPSFIPGLREIGNWPMNSWGAVYPRDGNVTQQHPTKASAVMSQRIGDVITRGTQPHVYSRLPTGGREMKQGFMVWYAPELKERDGSTGKWQMLSPNQEKNCTVFGDNDTVSITSWGDGKTSASASYAFNLWRPHSCCSQAGQIFLYAVTF